MKLFKALKHHIEKTRRPPKWQWFDVWVLGGAIIGLGIAFGVFCLVQLVLFRNGAVLLNIHRVAKDIKPSDILTMTATALGGVAIGGVAVMQLRKHKYEEYQAKLDEGTKTGERLSKAIEHLGLSKEENLHTRLGAIYEFKNLAEDSPRNKENIVEILTAFIKSYQHGAEKNVPQDIRAAARVLSPMVKELIEDTARRVENATKKSAFRLRPPQCVFDATEALSGFAVMGKDRWENEFLVWEKFKADWLDLDDILLKGADLFMAHLQGVQLSRAHLEGVWLNGAQLEGVWFTAAHLEGANLGSARLEGASLGGAYLEGTILGGAYLQGAELRRISVDDMTTFDEAHIDDNTRFSPGMRMKYFGVEEPEHGD